MKATSQVGAVASSGTALLEQFSKGLKALSDPPEKQPIVALAVIAKKLHASPQAVSALVNTIVKHIETVSFR